MTWLIQCVIENGLKPHTSTASSVLTLHPSISSLSLLRSEPVLSLSLSPSPFTQPPTFPPPFFHVKRLLLQWSIHGVQQYQKHVQTCCEHTLSLCDTAEHSNYFGTDEKLGPVAVSIRREKLDDTKDLKDQYQYRIIARTSEVLIPTPPPTACLRTARGNTEKAEYWWCHDMCVWIGRVCGSFAFFFGCCYLCLDWTSVSPHGPCWLHIHYLPVAPLPSLLPLISPFSTSGNFDLTRPCSEQPSQTLPWSAGRPPSTNTPASDMSNLLIQAKM